MVDQYGRWFPDYPGQQPFADPQFVALMKGQQPQQQAQQATPQQQQPVAASMTPPTIRAEIVQVDNEQSAAQYPVGAGMSQMMMAKDDSAIFVKTVMANGQYTLDVFDKRPPAQQPAPFNPAEYVRLDALPDLIKAQVQAAVAAMQPAKTTKTKKDTEVAE